MESLIIFKNIFQGSLKNVVVSSIVHRLFVKNIFFYMIDKK